MKHWIHKLWMAALLSVVAVSLDAQIRGVVTDSLTREKLPYISISYNNKGVGRTDNSGDYYVRVGDDWRTLTFSAVGYKTKTVSIVPGETRRLNVQLVPDNILLDEMVVRPRRERYR